jgi:hypothetical protein
LASPERYDFVNCLKFRWKSVDFKASPGETSSRGIKNIHFLNRSGFVFYCKLKSNSRNFEDFLDRDQAIVDWEYDLFPMMLEYKNILRVFSWHDVEAQGLQILKGYEFWPLERFPLGWNHPCDKKSLSL